MKIKQNILSALLLLYSFLSSIDAQSADSRHFDRIPTLEAKASLEEHREFETLLSYHILHNREHKQNIRTTFHCINKKVNSYLDNYIEKNPEADRKIFALMSLFICCRFKDHQDRSIFNEIEKFDIIASQLFHKIVFEHFTDHTPVLERSGSPFESTEITRGRRESEDYVETRAFGIRQNDDTHDLSTYFTIPYQSGVCQYEIDDTSTIAKHFKTIKMPFVCGLSGTVRIALGVMPSIIKLSQEEQFDYLFYTAICLIAANSHSLYEIFYAAEICDFPIKINRSSPRSLYLSMIPQKTKVDPRVQELLSTYIDESF